MLLLEGFVSAPFAAVELLIGRLQRNGWY